MFPIPKCVIDADDDDDEGRNVPMMALINDGNSLIIRFPHFFQSVFDLITSLTWASIDDPHDQPTTQSINNECSVSFDILLSLPPNLPWSDRSPIFLAVVSLHILSVSCCRDQFFSLQIYYSYLYYFIFVCNQKKKNDLLYIIMYTYILYHTYITHITYIIYSEFCIHKHTHTHTVYIHYTHTFSLFCSL